MPHLDKLVCAGCGQEEVAPAAMIAAARERAGRLGLDPRRCGRCQDPEAIKRAVELETQERARQETARKRARAALKLAHRFEHGSPAERAKIAGKVLTRALVRFFERREGGA